VFPANAVVTPTNQLLIRNEMTDLLYTVSVPSGDVQDAPYSVPDGFAQTFAFGPDSALYAIDAYYSWLEKPSHILRLAANGTSSTVNVPTGALSLAFGHDRRMYLLYPNALKRLKTDSTLATLTTQSVDVTARLFVDPVDGRLCYNVPVTGHPYGDVRCYDPATRQQTTLASSGQLMAIDAHGHFYVAAPATIARNLVVYDASGAPITIIWPRSNPDGVVVRGDTLIGYDTSEGSWYWYGHSIWYMPLPSVLR
jgi:hypothetical protein